MLQQFAISNLNIYGLISNLHNIRYLNENRKKGMPLNQIGEFFLQLFITLNLHKSSLISNLHIPGI